jgi:hypothetical protein
MKTRYLLFVLALVLFGCMTDGTTVSDSADLLKYNYAAISNVMDYGGPPILMDLEVRVFDILSATRLNMIGDKEIESLSETQKQELLLVKFAASQGLYEGSSVSINFVEYLTGRPIASCRGSSGKSLTPEKNTNNAMENAIKQLGKLFK